MALDEALLRYIAAEVNRTVDWMRLMRHFDKRDLTAHYIKTRQYQGRVQKRMKAHLAPLKRLDVERRRAVKMYHM